MAYVKALKIQCEASGCQKYAIVELFDRWNASIGGTPLSCQGTPQHRLVPNPKTTPRPCEIKRFAGGGGAIVCSRTKQKPRCAYCTDPGTQLCDFQSQPGRTCDTPMCRRHARHVHPNKDFCRRHADAE